MTGAETRFRQMAGVVCRRVMDEDLLVPIRGELADLQKVFALNAVGSAIWALLEAPRTSADIAAGLAREFEVEADAAQADADTFIRDLLAAGLVEPCQEPKSNPV